MGTPHLAQDLMVTKLVTVLPQSHVFEGLRTLLRSKVTGAPVVDDVGEYRGVFSEKCCMSVLARMARLADEGDRCLVNNPPARHFMTTNLVTLSPVMDVFEAIGHLLKNAISGAPVVDAGGQFLGVFSEKTSMRVLVAAAYDQIPATDVWAYTNTDSDRIISEDTDLLRCAQLFLDTSFRRLPVLRAGKLVGQVSRRDVLSHAGIVSSRNPDRDRIVLLNSHELGGSEGASEPAPDCFGSTTVGDFMDTHAKTIQPQLDLLSIAQIFLTTPYRRLPVLQESRLVGQVSRRDLLWGIHRSLEVVPRRERTLLYLSSLLDRNEAPIE